MLLDQEEEDHVNERTVATANRSASQHYVGPAVSMTSSDSRLCLDQVRDSTTFDDVRLRADSLKRRRSACDATTRPSNPVEQRETSIRSSGSSSSIVWGRGLLQQKSSGLGGNACPGGPHVPVRKQTPKDLSSDFLPSAKTSLPSLQQNMQDCQSVASGNGRQPLTSPSLPEASPSERHKSRGPCRPLFTLEQQILEAESSSKSPGTSHVQAFDCDPASQTPRSAITPRSTGHIESSYRPAPLSDKPVSELEVPTGQAHIQERTQHDDIAKATRLDTPFQPFSATAQDIQDHAWRNFILGDGCRAAQSESLRRDGQPGKRPSWLEESSDQRQNVEKALEQEDLAPSSTGASPSPSIKTAANTTIFEPNFKHTERVPDASVRTETDFLSQYSPMDGLLDERIQDLSVYNHPARTVRSFFESYAACSTDKCEDHAPPDQQSQTSCDAVFGSSPRKLGLPDPEARSLHERGPIKSSTMFPPRRQTNEQLDAFCQAADLDSLSLLKPRRPLGSHQDVTSLAHGEIGLQTEASIYHDSSSHFPGHTPSYSRRDGSPNEDFSKDDEHSRWPALDVGIPRQSAIDRVHPQHPGTSFFSSRHPAHSTRTSVDRDVIQGSPQLLLPRPPGRTRKPRVPLMGLPPHSFQQTTRHGSPAIKPQTRGPLRKMRTPMTPSAPAIPFSTPRPPQSKALHVARAGRQTLLSSVGATKPRSGVIVSSGTGVQAL